jgi:hypothetical protein
MTKLLYTVVKCKKMADELSHFILSTRACGTGPMSAQSMCVGVERTSSLRRAGGKRGGVGRVREVARGPCGRRARRSKRAHGGLSAGMHERRGGWLGQSTRWLV